MANRYCFTAKVWLYEGKAAWHFLTLPQELSAEIAAVHADRKRGWGSVPVRTSIGSTHWNTSLFPSTRDKAYFLPLKANVRKKENINEGSQVSVTLEIGA